jgi:alpha-tubulin suppressor-like RCC1 family protein
VLGTGAVRCWGEGWLGDGRGAQGAGGAGLVQGIDDAVEVRGSCVLRRSGEVWCWGSNGSGEIGDGTTASHSAPGPVRDLHDAVAIAAGDAHACALRRGGEAVCWGAAELGQLGDGVDQRRRLVPGPVTGVDDGVSIAARGQDTCVVRRGGGVACWGGQAYGALPEGHPGVTLPVGAVPEMRPKAVSGLADAVEVAAGPGHACARRASGGVDCWGDNADGQLGGGVAGRSGKLSAVGGIADAVRVAHGAGFACALRASGEVACWGDGTAGQLGDGKRQSRGSPVRVDLPGRAEAIAVAGEHACAVTSPGAIVCWGSGVPTPAGEAPEGVAPRPVTALADAVEVATAASHTCARRRGGQIACWGGDSDLGQLGARIAGGTAHGPVTVRIPGQATGVLTTEVGGCAWVRGGRLTCWGAGSISAWAPGPPGARQPPLAATVAPRVVPGLDGVEGAGERDGTLCALERTGRVRCWSSNGFSLLPEASVTTGAPVVTDGVGIHELFVHRSTGEHLAIDPATRAAVPVAPDLGEVVVASGTLDAGCAVRRGGTVACWGDDTFGQLGAGPSARSAQPIAVVGLTPPGH